MSGYGGHELGWETEINEPLLCSEPFGEDAWLESVLGIPQSVVSSERQRVLIKDRRASTRPRGGQVEHPALRRTRR